MLFIEATMENGQVWRVPIELVEHSYREHYRGDEAVGEDELIDWAQNNVLWEEVRTDAVFMRQTEEEDMETQWCNAKMCVIEEAPRIVRPSG